MRGVTRHLLLIRIFIFMNAAFHVQTTINIELILHKMDFSTLSLCQKYTSNGIELSPFVLKSFFQHIDGP